MKKSFYILSILLSILIFSCEGDDQASISPDVSNTGQGGSLARFAIVGNTMYLVDNSSIKVFDVTNADSPEQVNDVFIPSNTIETIFSLDNHLFLGSSNGLFIYDISAPQRPIFLSRATHQTGCDPVVSDGTYAYVTIRNSQSCNRFNDINVLEIYDVEDPTFPRLISRLDLTFPQGLAIKDSTLFVADNGIKIIDVSVPRNPVILKTLPSTAFDFIIDGDYLLAVTNEGIEQFSYDPETVSLTQLGTVKYNK